MIRIEEFLARFVEDVESERIFSREDFRTWRDAILNARNVSEWSDFIIVRDTAIFMDYSISVDALIATCERLYNVIWKACTED